MEKMTGQRQRAWIRQLAWALLILCVVFLLVWGALEAGGADFFFEVLGNIFDSKALMATLSKPQYAIAAFLALTIIVFMETGLLIGFFLPGDSLLVTAGLICANSDWSLPLLLVTLCLAAIVGDS